MATQEIFNSVDISSPGGYGPSQTALLLLDFHSGIVYKMGGPEAVAALEVASKLRVWAKSQGILVVHALIDEHLKPSPTCKNAERYGAFLSALQTEDGPEPKELLENSNELDVTFTRRIGHVSALKSPGLDDTLSKKGIKSLILTGLSTSGCVLRTAITASDAGYVVTVISDGCADPAEGLHDMLVGKVLNSRGYVTTADEFQKGFADVNGTK